MPIAPSSPLVCPSRSISSAPCVPSTLTSPNTQAFQRALAAARNSPPDPPDPDPSNSDHGSEYSDIFLDDDEDMSTTPALVDIKAGLPEDFSRRNEDAR